MGRRTVALLMLAAVCRAQDLSSFAGIWVGKSGNLPVISLRVTLSGETLTGSLRTPESYGTGSGGEIETFSGKLGTTRFTKCRLAGGVLHIDIDGASVDLELVGADVAAFGPSDVPLKVKLRRVPPGTTVVLADKVPEPNYSPRIVELRARLKEMTKVDQDARMAFDDARMKAADERHRAEIMRIFEEYGWPKASVIGRDAAHDYWLLVQHQTAAIMQRLLPEMEKAMRADEASMADYSLLYDRVQGTLGKPQHYGNGVHCENGKPVLDPVDDPAGLAQRRRELFLMPIEAYMSADYIVRSCEKR